MRKTYGEMKVRRRKRSYLLNKRAICKLEETEGLLGVIHVANHEILLSNALPAEST